MAGRVDRFHPRVYRSLRARAGVAVILGALLVRGSVASDCNTNGIEDSEDIAAGRSLDCNRNSVPDECDIRGGVEFSGPRAFPIGLESPMGVVAADLDGDGDPDLASANGSGSVTLLWNGGTRDIADGAGITGLPPLLAIAAGDLDGDGRCDLAAGGTSGIFVLRNRDGRRFDRGL